MAFKETLTLFQNIWTTNNDQNIIQSIRFVKYDTFVFLVAGPEIGTPMMPE